MTKSSHSSHSSNGGIGGSGVFGHFGTLVNCDSNDKSVYCTIMKIFNVIFIYLIFKKC